MDLAPIVLFVYNRPSHTQQTLRALEENMLASDSLLYIFADGPRENANEQELEKIEEVRKIIKSKRWCKKSIIVERSVNLGLGDSIVSGVTEVVNKHEKIIVLEDDIVTSEGFLKYMNDSLFLYQNDCKVMHISAYMYPHKRNLPETFFLNVPLCWGWATWKRAWNYFNKDSFFLHDYFERKNKWLEFNRFGGKFLQNQLADNISGKLSTWFIKWHASVMMQKGYSLFPSHSLVQNIGFDSSGVHNGTSDKFHHVTLKKYLVIKRVPLRTNLIAEKEIKKFYEELDVNNYEKISVNNKPTKHFFIKSFLLINIKSFLKKIIRKLVLSSVTDITQTHQMVFEVTENLHHMRFEIDYLKNSSGLFNNPYDCGLSKKAKAYLPFTIVNSIIGDYTYIAENSKISITSIGKFCSIGPNFLCGWGIHPTNGISTSPMFYSTLRQNGTTLSQSDKFVERKQIKIGNDVFIGMNVTVLDGVKIGDGAIIGAGAVVTKDIPPYAVAVGNPIKIINYRFTEDQIEKLLRIRWWDFTEPELQIIEKSFFNVEDFIEKYSN